MSSIQEFYSAIQFPGHYTAEQLAYHNPNIRNRYLMAIDSVLKDGQKVLDVGCGTGLISNLFAQRYPNSQFTAIDFSDSVDYAQQFARTHNINNVEYIKDDFVNHKFDTDYHVVICQGVLHHIPNNQQTIIKLKDLVKPHHYLALGLYHPWGKFAKKWFTINYNNHVLYQDQELNKYETAYTCGQVFSLFSEFSCLRSYPSAVNVLSHIEALFNYTNGGLITYILEKNK